MTVKTKKGTKKLLFLWVLWIVLLAVSFLLPWRILLGSFALSRETLEALGVIIEIFNIVTFLAAIVVFVLAIVETVRFVWRKMKRNAPEDQEHP